MTNKTPLADLIEDRLHALKLSKEALGQRLGYTNLKKAVGRVQALCDARPFSEKSRRALQRLSTALALPTPAVEEAVVATEQLLTSWAQEAEEQRLLTHEAVEASWRASFQPHAVIQTEHTVPTQITLCAVTGGARRWLMIPFDLSLPPVTYVQQVVDAVPRKVRLGRDGQHYVPFFGRALGLIINYTPNSALRCDLDGKPHEVLQKECRVGDARRHWEMLSTRL